MTVPCNVAAGLDLVGLVGLQVNELRVLESRAGESRLTLADSGRFMSISRERARQLYKRVVSKFMRALGTNAELFQLLESLEDSFDNGALTTGQAATLNDVGMLLQRELSRAGFTLQEGFGYLLALLVRAGCDLQETTIWDSWPLVSYLCCRAPARIGTHPLVESEQEQIRLEDKRIRATTSYRSIALKILRDHRQPMHWSAIADAARKERSDEGFSTSSMYNMLVASEQFVRTGVGEYGLAEWGLSDARHYTDIIDEVLRNARRPLTQNQIKFAVDEIRPIKQSSLAMYLALSAGYYESLEGTFGLREWLPPPEQQTLLTPDAFCETSASRRRLEKSDVSREEP